jgi:iron complex transport system substrate-binding protein
MNPNVERMLSLRPSVVFHAPTVNGPQERLAAAGIRVVPLANESLADVYSGIEIMGRELGMEDRAADLVARSREELEALQEELADAARPSVLFVIGHAPGSLRDIHAAGPDTFLDELITIAGGSNHMANAPTRYPVVSRESLIQHPPDLVIMAAPTGGWSDGEQEQLRAQWRTLLGNAGQAVRVEFLDSPELTIPGPLVHRSARLLALLMHPSIAKD